MLQMNKASQEPKSRITDENRAEFKKKFYSPKLPENFDVARQVLEQYSGIPADQVDDHVLKIRDAGWEIFPFPCIGQFRFLELNRALEDKRFQVALKRLRQEGSEDRFLDVGCFVGQVARMLAFSGVDPDKLYGTDLEQAYLDLGYDLFRDEHKLSRDHFIAGNMVQDPKDPRLDPFVGKMSLINASSFFHLFDMPLQLEAAKRCVDFLNPDANDVMIFGRMAAREESGCIPGPGSSKLFTHNADSWAQLWEQTGAATGTKWRTEFEFVDEPEFARDNPMIQEFGVKRARFGAFRLK